jgi:hypothetical protein
VEGREPGSNNMCARVRPHNAHRFQTAPIQFPTAICSITRIGQLFVLTAMRVSFFFRQYN